MPAPRTADSGRPEWLSREPLTSLAARPAPCPSQPKLSYRPLPHRWSLPHAGRAGRPWAGEAHSTGPPPATCPRLSLSPCKRRRGGPCGAAETGRDYWGPILSGRGRMYAWARTSPLTARTREKETDERSRCFSRPRLREGAELLGKRLDLPLGQGEPGHRQWLSSPDNPAHIRRLLVQTRSWPTNEGADIRDHRSHPRDARPSPRAATHRPQQRSHPDEIVELFIHLEAYAGAARASDSYLVALEVFAEDRP